MDGKLLALLIREHWSAKKELKSNLCYPLKYCRGIEMYGSTRPCSWIRDLEEKPILTFYRSGLSFILETRAGEKVVHG